MFHQKIKIGEKEVDGVVIPLGPVNLVTLVLPGGMMACGLVDIQVLNQFNYPAVKIKSSHGGLIQTVEDLLSGTVREVNKEALKKGIDVGMKAQEVVILLDQKLN